MPSGMGMSQAPPAPAVGPPAQRGAVSTPKGYMPTTNQVRGQSFREALKEWYAKQKNSGNPTNADVKIKRKRKTASARQYQGGGGSGVQTVGGTNRLNVPDIPRNLFGNINIPQFMQSKYASSM